jgi:hypothetical protein
MLKEEMIDRLIEDDIATVRNGFENNDAEYLYSILLNGKGYDNMTLREIIDEYNSRTWEDS